MLVAVIALVCALLGGCAGMAGRQVDPGTPREAVIARFGPPTRVVPLPSGERLQYSLQPMGQEAYMVDLDASGRVVSVRQVLTEAEFSRIVVGQWTRADVEREFGPPAMVDHTGDWAGDVLTYRWKDFNDMFYWVYVDANQVVGRVQQGMEFSDIPDDPRF